MKRAIEKGGYVRVASANKDDYYMFEGMDQNGAQEMLKSFGFSDEFTEKAAKTPVSAPKKDMELDVVEVARGAIYLKDTGGKFYLCEASSLRPAKKLSDVKYLLMMNKDRLEEYSTLQEVKDRIKDLISSKVADFTTTFRVYEIANIKEVKVDVGIFLG